MSEAKFTKGPWEVVDGYYPSFIEIKCGEMMDISICWHATDLSYSDGVERRANAHLIAAAPDMYEMLASLREDYGLLSAVGKDIDMLLAKARGEV